MGKLRGAVSNPWTDRKRQRSVGARHRQIPIYAAWINKQGDRGDVPLADDFKCSGPVASFEDADGFRSMSTQAGQAMTKFSVREQFVNGNRVCSIVDWEVSLPVSPMTAAEILEVEDDEIVRGEVIYDAEELRQAIAGTGLRIDRQTHG